MESVPPGGISGRFEAEGEKDGLEHEPLFKPAMGEEGGAGVGRDVLVLRSPGAPTRTAKPRHCEMAA